MVPFRTLALAAAGLATLAALATPPGEPTTVCTVTVNSADERDVFQRYLPAQRYRFVELAQLGQRDWLKSACQARVRCDVLVVSGHFAGTAFYSSKHGEHLPVDEIERVSCSDSCPGLFSNLKEVYLFGCDTLKDEPVRTAAPEIVRGLVAAGMPPSQANSLARSMSLRHAEGARERMRRLFPGTPVIYGFSSLAPYGRVAGPMLRGYFEGGAPVEVGSGIPSSKLLKLFAPSSMVATSGQRAGDENAAYRTEACRYYDDRVNEAQRLAFMHELLGRDMVELRMAFDRVERWFASVDPALRADPAFAAQWARLVDDEGARRRYLALTRETRDPALRVRMVALARAIDWLSAEGQRVELAAMIQEMLAANAAGFGEVDLVCSLNSDGSLESELARFKVAQSATSPANAAALACLGSAPSRSRMLQALASADEGEVQLAQAYLRHRPITDAAELRELVRRIAHTPSPAAQARALETVARHHVEDAGTLEDLAQLFTRSKSLAVQRAIAEVFIRSGTHPSAELAARFRAARVRPGDELIEAMIRRLSA